MKTEAEIAEARTSIDTLIAACAAMSVDISASERRFFDGALAVFEWLANEASMDNPIESGVALYRKGRRRFIESN